MVSPGIVRVLFTRTPDTRPPPSFAIAGARAAGTPYTLVKGPNEVTVRTAELGVRITREPLRIALLDAQGRVVSEEVASIEWQRPGAKTSWKLAADAHIYGLGDKARGGLDRRGQRFEMWNSDAYGWAPDADPLYKTIPFLVFLERGQAHGLFIDTPARAQVDVGASDPSRLTYRAEAGDSLDVYLLAGPDPKRVVREFATLTGRTPLPPRWALGYHQSRYSYLTEAEVRALASRLRADRIPTDAIWLDIDYQQKNAPFTVDPEAFPHFAQLIADLEQSGLHTVVITDPHLKSYQGQALPSGYVPYDSGAQGDQFVHDGRGFFVGNVWPGDSVFPEFTLSRTRKWWGELYGPFAALGIAGFWNDMNEPALLGDVKTLPGSIRHRLDDGSTLDHTFVHNAYGSLNAQATYEGLRALRPNVRPFVLTRAAYAGTQRYAASWTGDNSASREHLAITIPQLTNLGVSGYPLVGADVGGFVGCPDPELLVEWTELAAFQPFFRNHSMKDSCRREPWVHGEAVEAQIRNAIERRYALLPYLYTSFEETSRTGLPVMRPLWLEYPMDESTALNARAYLLGRDLLIAPKLLAGNIGYRVQLPRADWFDTVSGELQRGGGAVEVPPSSESVRVFARAGAIVPSQPVVQFADQVPAGPLRIDVWPGADCQGALYLDDGQSFAFEQGAFRRIAYQCAATSSGVTVRSSSTGAFPSWWRATELVVHGIARAPASVMGPNGALFSARYDAAHHSATIEIPGNSADWAVTLGL